MQIEEKNMETRLPLIYAICVITFPDDQGLGQIADQLKKELADWYPKTEKFPINNLGFEIDPEKNKLNFTSKQEDLWQFTDNDIKWGVFLINQKIGVHTIAYNNHDDLIKRENILLKIIESSDLFKKINGIALRYINLIDVESEDNEYIHDIYKPDIIPINDHFKLLNCYRNFKFTSDRTHLTVQIAKNPEVTFPVDLQSPLVVKNQWIPKKPDGNFIVVDIDCGRTFLDSQKNITIDNVLNSVREMMKLTHDMFYEITTTTAQKKWGIQC